MPQTKEHGVVRREHDRSGADPEGSSASVRGPEGEQRGSPEDGQLLTPGEVAQLFGVDPKTVARWSDAGRLDALRTLGGHRRYRAEQVHALLGEADS